MTIRPGAVRALTFVLAAGAGLAAVHTPAEAHFKLIAPTPVLEQNALGDPQKLGPCGGTSANAGTPTGAVTELVGGSLLHLQIQETVFHPGHYRVALAVLDRAELPADPETLTRDTEKGPRSVSAKIEAKPKPPVLADGLFEHMEKVAPGQLWETDVKVPNINCDGCTLQVIQWMGEHGYNKDGGYSYHHCATLKITADPKLRLDRRWPGQAKSPTRR